MVSLLDVYPTLIDLCGLPANPTLEGQSLRILFENPDAGWTRPAVTTFAGDNHAVQSANFRYIRWKDGAEELYDHRIDPLEETILAGAEEYGDLKAALQKWIPAVRD